MLNNPKKIVDRWYGEEPISLDDGVINTLSYTVAAVDKEITEQQKILVQQVLNRYKDFWPEIAKKLIQIEPEVMTNMGNRLLFYAPGYVNNQKYDFMLGYEIKKDNEIVTSYFFAYIQWKLMFFEKVH